MRNIVLGILAHVDAGKTTMSEAMLYKTGITRTLGRVDHKDAYLDTNRLEKPILKKLQAMDIAEEMPQDKLIDYADDMQLDLMTDDDGSIIIMDDKDLSTFVNLLNEDYYVSPVNGRRYEIKSKKLLSEPDGEPPRG